MSIFRSFLMGGYECADHINRSGERVNLLRETEHDIRAEEDYRDIAELDIKVVREGICWSAVETAPYVFDFTEVQNRIHAADKLGIQIIWDLCHFGYPDGLIPTHPQFCDRFVALCKAFASFHKTATKQQLFVVPFNEISFLAWHSGDVRGTVPFAVNSGFDIKYHLCKAAILGIDALKETDPNCRIVLVEPVIKIHAAHPDDAELVEELNSHQFQAMDIIAGRMCPELGGKEENLDILGFNYYWNNQWEHNISTLPWPETEPKREKLSNLLQAVYLRYNRPIFLSETGHFGDGRTEWIEEVTQECVEALNRGVQLEGMCIYPITDRPDWDNLQSYSNCGIWDLDHNKNRIPYLPLVNTVFEAQKVLSYCLNNGPAIEAERELAEIAKAYEKFKSVSHESI
jgi:beta-glucosidase/6-phospho-beta-glucosidase/beta-galactosidase